LYFEIVNYQKVFKLDIIYFFFFKISKNEGYRSSDPYADLINLLRVIITLMIALVD